MSFLNILNPPIFIINIIMASVLFQLQKLTSFDQWMKGKNNRAEWIKYLYKINGLYAM